MSADNFEFAPDQAMAINKVFGAMPYGGSAFYGYGEIGTFDDLIRALERFRAVLSIEADRHNRDTKELDDNRRQFAALRELFKKITES